MDKMSSDHPVCVNDMLPDECLNLAFNLLPLSEKIDCMKVCRRWHDLIEGLLVINKEIRVPQLGEDASLTERYLVSDGGIQKLLRVCRNVQLIEVTPHSTCNFDPFHFIATINKCCHRIKVLKVLGLLGLSNTVQVAEKHFTKLVSKLSCLEVLEMPRWCATDNFLNYLFARCRRLRSLSLGGVGFSNVSAEPFKRAPVTLCHLDISKCYVDVKIFLHLASRCAGSIESIKARSCHNFPPNCVQSISQFRYLKHVDLSGNTKWVCGRLGVKRFTPLSNLRYLEVLNIEDTKCLHDVDLLAIVEKCSRLRELNVAFSSANNTCLTQKALTALKFAKNMEYLNLSGQWSVDDNVIKCVACLPNLKSLILIECRSITNLALTLLSHLADNLVQLNVMECTSIEYDFESKLFYNTLKQFAERKRSTGRLDAKLAIDVSLTNLVRVYDEFTVDEMTTLRDRVVITCDTIRNT